MEFPWFFIGIKMVTSCIFRLSYTIGFIGDKEIAISDSGNHRVIILIVKLLELLESFPLQK
jgi:hypothetical protein